MYCFNLSLTNGRWRVCILFSGFVSRLQLPLRWAGAAGAGTNAHFVVDSNIKAGCARKPLFDTFQIAVARNTHATHLNPLYTCSVDTSCRCYP